MAGTEDWVDIGATDELARLPLRSAKAKAVDIALSVRDGTWGALSNACNHVGGPLVRDALGINVFAESRGEIMDRRGRST